MPMMQEEDDGALMTYRGNPDIEDVPPPEKCIGQVVLDWEFIHDLDLHLLKVVSLPAPSPTEGCNHWQNQTLEPNPEPNPEFAPDPTSRALDLASLVDPVSNALRLQSYQTLVSVASYASKVHNPGNDDTPQVILELDRNAAVPSIKPVENLYFTDNLEEGVYVIGVHNYTQRQLHEDVIGPSKHHTYRSFEEFQKKDAGYLMMAKALDDQVTHAGDEDGTPEKLAIMTKVDKDMAEGFGMMSQQCGEGMGGVHYGVTVYTYPETGEKTKHPQACSVEDLQNLFKTDFFATSECVYDPEHISGYNGANVLANVHTEDGKLALLHNQAAHVALLRISQDAHSGKASIAEVKLLHGIPHSRGLAMDEDHGDALQRPIHMSCDRLLGRHLQQSMEPFPETIKQQQERLPFLDRAAQRLRRLVPSSRRTR